MKDEINVPRKIVTIKVSAYPQDASNGLTVQFYNLTDKCKSSFKEVKKLSKDNHIVFEKVKSLTEDEYDKVMVNVREKLKC